MTATPVGMRCPDCSKQKTKVRTAAAIGGGDPIATYVIIGICVLAFFGSSSGGSVTSGGGSTVFDDGALFGPAISVNHEYWRLITSGFLHGGILHIAFNMYILYFLGQMLEPALGKARFVGLYFASMLGGSFGALLLSPDKFTVGASGAVFGLMGAAFVMQRARGIDPMQSGIAPMILLNLGISFLPGLNISIGGHLGGLAVGALTALALERIPRRGNADVAAVGACIAVGVVAAAGGIAVAGAKDAELGIGAIISLLG
jgi:membrane associated rhomboid family serine protease